jgi:hypothetical protein
MGIGRPEKVGRRKRTAGSSIFFARNDIGF